MRERSSVQLRLPPLYTGPAYTPAVFVALRRARLRARRAEGEHR